MRQCCDDAKVTEQDCIDCGRCLDCCRCVYGLDGELIERTGEND